MRFKRQRTSHLPEVNLVPMLDVLMTVLTFFIIVSMTLTTQQGIDVQLPSRAENAPSPAADSPRPFVVRLSHQGITVDDRPISKAQLSQPIQDYLVQNPKGLVALVAAPDVPYEQVVELLGEMKAIGQDRVFLAIE